MYRFDEFSHSYLVSLLEVGSFEDPYLLSGEDQTTLEEIMTHLSNVDYSLHSPLIVDETKDFLLWLRGHDASKRWNTQKFERMKLLFEPDLLILHPDPIDNFAKWFGFFNLNTEFKQNKGFLDLINETYKLSLITKPVVDAFFKGWIGSIPDTTRINYTKMVKATQKWGCYFWELHQLALFLNCTNKTEAEALCKEFNKTKYLGCNVGHEFHLHLDNFGDVKVGHGFAYFTTQKLFLDRNVVLMMKDAYIARFNTLLSVQFRLDYLYPFDAVD